ncbi:MAG: HPP family protein [Paracoccaceae bacterium]|nr:HPP family protein [Paracoccaceae bacterium]
MALADRPDQGRSLLGRSLERLRPFGPVIGPTSRRDMTAGAVGAGMALVLCAAIILGTEVNLASGAFLIAPMGASAVILFALPNSPLAQPWSAVVGNSISALAALDGSPVPSATCHSETVLPIRLRPDFSVVFGGYAGWAVNRPTPQRAHSRSLRADILQTC